jgi:hypothetical protein
LRETDGWGLRVYLDRDWFSSGDGEQLAVLFGLSPNVGTLSQIASDPARMSRAVINDLSPDSVLNPQRTEAGLQRIVVANAQPSAVAVRDRVQTESVQICSFDVSRNEAKDLLFADIILKPRQAYRPFVRLALARYQAMAVEGARLSSTVLADFIQLSPSRTLSLVRQSESIIVSVGGEFTRQTDGDITRTAIIAIVERLRGGFLSGSDTWEEIQPARLRLQPDRTEAGFTTWTVQVPTLFCRRSCEKVAPAGQFEGDGTLPITCLA